MRIWDEGRMARSELRLFLAAVAVSAGGCDEHRDEAGQGSITVTLPPARPLSPGPAFRMKPSDTPEGSKDSTRKAGSLAD